MNNSTNDGTIDPPIDPASIPAPIFERDDQGMVKGRVYPRRPDGRIDWFKLIPTEHIKFNDRDPKIADAIQKEYGKAADQLVYADVIKDREVDPRHILVLLWGWIELLHLRGGSAHPRVVHVTPYPKEAANVTCETMIDWEPNAEDRCGFSSYGVADATFENTGGFGYLAQMASNRSLARAVRMGLRVPVYGFDEIARASTPTIQEAGAGGVPTQSGPLGTLQRAAQEAGFSFDEIKKAAADRWLEDNVIIAAATTKGTTPLPKRRIESDPALWSGWADLKGQPRDCVTLITLIKTATAARKNNLEAKAATAAAATTAAKKATKPKVSAEPATAAA